MIVDVAYIVQRLRQVKACGSFAGKAKKQFGEFTQPLMRTIDHRGIQRVRNLLARGMHVFYRVRVLHFRADKLGLATMY